MTNTTWNPNNISGGITLDSTDLIVSTTSEATVLSNRNITSNLSYFEVEFTTLTGSGSVGLFCSGGNESAFLGNDSYTLGYKNDGTVNVNGTVIATILPYTSGAHIGIAINLAKRLVWFTLDGNNWNNDTSANQNPGSLLGGISFSSINYCSPYAALSLNTNGDGAIGIFNSSDFDYDQPTNFQTLDTTIIRVSSDITEISLGQSINRHSPGACGPGINDGSGSALVFAPAGSIKSVSGTIIENGVPVSKTVRVYDQASGMLIGSTVSDPITGYYQIPTARYTLVDIVALGDSTFRARIFDNIVPH